MVRKLKHHERKLLKKVDFINWDNNNLKEIGIMRRYGINREEYTRYNKLCRLIRQLSEKIAAQPLEGFRVQAADQLVEKLHALGVIKTKRLKKCDQIDVKSFARRRLPIFMVQSGLFNGPVATSIKYVEHGHVRVGPTVVRDPAFIVTRNHEDFVTWTDKFRQKIETYNEIKDDYSE